MQSVCPFHFVCSSYKDTQLLINSEDSQSHLLFSLTTSGNNQSDSLSRFLLRPLFSFPLPRWPLSRVTGWRSRCYIRVKPGFPFPLPGCVTALRRYVTEEQSRGHRWEEQHALYTREAESLPCSEPVFPSEHRGGCKGRCVRTEKFKKLKEKASWSSSAASLDFQHALHLNCYQSDPRLAELNVSDNKRKCTVLKTTVKPVIISRHYSIKSSLWKCCWWSDLWKPSEAFKLDLLTALVILDHDRTEDSVDTVSTQFHV